VQIMTKPLFMWAGGKNKMLKHYKPLMPSSVESYCEPFFGGGAMFIYVMNTYSPKYARINDINPDIARIYSSIKNDLVDFTHRLDELESIYIPMSKKGRKEYYYEVRHEHAYDYETWSPAYEAATLYFLMKTGFNGIFQINQNTNGRYGTPSGLLNQKDKVYDRDVLQWWHNALQKTEIYCGDWKDAVENCPEDTFFFFDPPYRESFANYGNGFSDEQLIDLISFCDKQTSVMMSNRDDEDWFAKQKHTLKSVNFDIFYTAGRRKKTVEGYDAKKAREILLYRITGRLTRFMNGNN
jgi:DNA adenine methylase